jgi:hypothetical protein
MIPGGEKETTKPITRPGKCRPDAKKDIHFF